METLTLDSIWKPVLWSQFGAAIDMLENALVACPDSLWDGPSEQQAFWYTVYHALFWLDLYLSGSVEGFRPPAPFTLDELDPVGLLPDRVYTKDELRSYLQHGRAKCRATIESLTDERASQRCTFSWGDVSFAELLVYNMRHVQDHASQLGLIIGQKFGAGPGWVGRTRNRGA